jgi:uncharacterized protein YjbI with pentapeptide repeats
VKSEALRAIIESNVDDLRTLAQLAGGHPTSFYRGANFDDADLRGQDLRGFNLQAATFRRTRVDRHTKVDPQYIKDVGLERKVKVQFKIYDSILRNCGITLEKPIAEHLGDILEDALFERKRALRITPSRDFEFTHNAKEYDMAFEHSNKIYSLEFKNAKVSGSIGSGKTYINRLFIERDDLFSKLAVDLGRERSMTALLSLRTGEQVMRQAKRNKQQASDFCAQVMLSYMLSHSQPGTLLESDLRGANLREIGGTA